MVSLIVRKLDDDLAQRLKARAKAHGRSAEAEHRLILQEALCSRPKMTGAEFWEALRQDGPLLDDDDEFSRRSKSTISRSRFRVPSNERLDPGYGCRVRAAPGPSTPGCYVLVSQSRSRTAFPDCDDRVRARGRDRVPAFRQAPDRNGELARHPPQATVRGRILPYDTKAGLIYGELAAARVRGRNPGFSDAQIAAVAKVNDMAVATPNVADFERLGVAVVNPWAAG